VIARLAWPTASRGSDPGSAASLPSASRWAYLARQVDLKLVRADDWGALAATLDHAAAADHELRTLLPEVIGANPLAEDEPAADLRYRLMERLGVDETPLPQSPTATARDPRGRATTIPRPNPYDPPPGLEPSPLRAMAPDLLAAKTSG